MCRSALAVLTLAAFIVAAASAQDFRVKTHRRASSASSAHASHRSATALRNRRSAPIHATARSYTPGYRRTAHKPTPDEVGRMAGLAIRRQLGEQPLPRRTSPHMVRVRAVRTSGYRRRIESSPHEDAADPERDAKISNDMTSASPVETAASAPNLSPARPGDEEAAITAPPVHAGAGASGPSPLGTGESAEHPSFDDAPSEGAPPRTTESQPARLAIPQTDSEEASLLVPHSGTPSSLRGSLESLERQNNRLEAEGLERIEDEADLSERIAHKLLVPVPVSSALTVNADLPENHRYCRPWTARFLADLAREHEAAFHKPLEVSSAVRTVEYQERLMRSNGNAAPAEGDIVSPHLTGATIDIAKKGLTRGELDWMRQRLAALEATGKIDVEEEFRQACFHITVYKDYAPPRPTAPGRSAKPGSKARPAPAEPDDAAAQGF